MGITTTALIPQVQVNIPFGFLFSGYLERFLQRGLGPLPPPIAPGLPLPAGLSPGGGGVSPGLRGPLLRLEPGRMAGPGRGPPGGAGGAGGRAWGGGGGGGRLWKPP